MLGQYGLLHALEHQQDVARLLILNTPLATKTKLRPELAAYKNPLPFLRPGSKPFDGYNYNASGSPYAMQARDAEVYGTPYQTSPEASVAVAETMDKVSFCRGSGSGWCCERCSAWSVRERHCWHCKMGLAGRAGAARAQRAPANMALALALPLSLDRQPCRAMPRLPLSANC